MNWEIRTDTDTHPCVEQTASGTLHGELSSGLCDDWEERDGRGVREAPEGRDICMHVVGSLRCTEETNNLKNKWTPREGPDSLIILKILLNIN